MAKDNGGYDFVSIGAGVTGLAAGMYAARLGLKTLILGASHGKEMPIGGVITTTNIVENYPGFVKLTGTELSNKIRDHALSYDLVEIKEEKAESVKKKGNGFIIKTDKGEHLSRTVLFATGTKWKKLKVPGAEEFENKGVAFCALCDGALFKDKVLGLVGGGDSAAKDALVLAEHAKKVYMIYRGNEIHPEPINMERVKANKKIEVIANTNVVEVKGRQMIESVFLDKPFKGDKEFKLGGLFIAIGHDILSELAVPLGVKLNKKKEIMIDHKTSETSVPGIFAAGDVSDKPFKQAITGVSEGCTAAHSAFEFISKGRV